jgi:hypothetical protein
MEGEDELLALTDISLNPKRKMIGKSARVLKRVTGGVT